VPADELLAIALDAAVAAGALLSERFGTHLTGVVSKSSATDVATDADRDAERLLLGRIHAARPDDAIIAEESGAARGRSGIEWVVDPLDGTTNFVYGHRAWCVSVACRDRDGGLAAVVHDPSGGETFTAVRGGGARCNGAPIQTSPLADPATALIGTGFGYSPARRALQAVALAHLLPGVRDIRRGGSAALDLAWTACGRLDGFYEAGINDWDRAAGLLLVEEAGGRTELIEPGLDGADCCVAAGAALFEPLRGLVVAALADARTGPDRLH
jgi:myo-inositol-1(or 4)-monophosphatase